MASKIKDLTGLSFGRWTVLSLCQTNKTRTRWNCRCNCGTERIIAGYRLLGEESKSCGCWQREKTGIISTTHGETRTHTKKETPEYTSWRGMKSRCLNKNSENYYKYGAKGVSICESWMHYENFLRDMGRRPSALHSIDRIDNRGNYEPSNCRWSTPKEQAENRRSSIKITIGDETLPASRWESRMGLKPKLIAKRIWAGWNPIKAVLTPVRKRTQRIKSA
jgi:hypothetical protein